MQKNKCPIFTKHKTIIFKLPQYLGYHPLAAPPPPPLLTTLV